jgi:excisionase family DNA binding protein
MRLLGRICAGKEKGPSFGPDSPGERTVNDTELLTVDQVADRLQIRPRTVKAWARQGRIPAVKLSAKVVRFVWAAVLAALRDQADPQEVRHVS